MHAILTVLRRNLLLRFSIVSFVICAAIAVGFAYALQQQLITDALDQQAHEGAAIVDGVLWRYLSAPEMVHPATGVRYRRLNALVSQVKADRSIVRIKIWNRAGQVYYSDDRRIVGRNFGIDEDLRSALEGHTSTSVSDLSQPENVDERGLASQLLQTYVPVWDHGHRHVIGVYEIYGDMRAVQPRIDQIHRLVFLGVGIGFLVLYLSLFAIMRNASRQLARQARDLEQTAAENARLLREAAETEALREVDRLKDEFISVVSHELRRPLASIKGYAQTLLLHHDWDEATRQELLTIIDEESDRLAEQIADLLDMSRLGTGMLTLQKEPVLLPHLAHEACRRIATSGHLDDHRFSVRFPPSFPLVEADPTRVTQVLVNLVENAVKYSAPGTEVVIRGREVEVGRMVEIDVVDQGIGIDERHRDRIFDRFYRVDNSLARRTQGAGLGLAICKGIVEAHGGRIWASNHGAGATISFTLPCTPYQHEPQAVLQEQEQR